MIARDVRLLIAFVLLVVLQTPAARAIEQSEALSVDPDYQIQGEYVGEVVEPNGKGKFGVQVMAFGNGKFRAVSYAGGLPGDGWDKRDKRECNGETVNDVTIFKDTTSTMKIKDGALVITGNGDKLIGNLSKVARQSSTLAAKAPEGAMVLFDGKNADHWEKCHLTDDGLLMQGATSKPKFESGKLHIEFRLPFDLKDIHRGNSGCYLQGRYEVQIVNSIGLAPHEHECGAIPFLKPSDVNMCYPPLAWQTYDIDFTAAQYKDDKKEKNSRMTVRHNGVLIHVDVEVPDATGGGPLPEGPGPGPIYLQDHGSEVRYRNIWFVEK